ncbi:ectopic p granules protein [Anaeramoeba ignava]|uniref:Ectopic p granules protein n=1 Tax=Anaeramoeba ignava TaxID=1746090 RepID=A0A9Q0L9H6_ANAIG|nr:ectopic p granules protein [Anaeramoeba ignava]
MPNDSVQFVFGSWLVDNLFWGYSPEIDGTGVLNDSEAQFKIIPFSLIGVGVLFIDSMFTINLANQMELYLNFPMILVLICPSISQKDKKQSPEPFIAFLALMFFEIRDNSTWDQFFQNLLKAKEYYSMTKVLHVKIPQILKNNKDPYFKKEVATISELVKPLLKIDKFNAHVEEKNKSVNFKRCNALASMIESLIMNRMNVNVPFHKQDFSNETSTSINDNIANVNENIANVNENMDNTVQGNLDQNQNQENLNQNENQNLNDKDNPVPLEKMIQFWLQFFESIPKWNKDKQIIKYFDIIFRSAFMCRSRPLITRFIAKEYSKIAKGKKKTGVFSKKEKQVTLIDVGKTFVHRGRTKIMNKSPWYYFEVLLVELIWHAERLDSLGIKINKSKDIPLKQILKKNKINTNFDIINWWIEFVTDLKENNRLLPIVMQVVCSIYFLCTFKGTTTLDTVKDSDWFGKNLLELTGKSVDDIKKQIVDILDFELEEATQTIKDPKKHKYKDGAVRDYNANIVRMYQSMKTWFSHKSLQRLIPEPITQNHEEFLNLIHSNILNPYKSKFDLKSPTNETLLKLHNSLWFHLLSMQKIMNDIYTNMQLIQDLPNYVYFLINKTLKPRLQFPPLSLKMAFYQHLTFQNLSQISQSNLMILNSPVNDLQKRYPILLESSSKFVSFRSHHISLNNEYISSSTSLYSNVPTTQTVHKTCHYTTTSRDSHGHTHTHHHSHQVAFHFNITQVVQDSNVNSRMIANRATAQTYLIPSKNPNNSLGSNNISTYMVYLDFAEQCADIAKKQQFQLPDYPIDNLWKVCIEWFYQILNYDSTSSDAQEFPTIQFLIKEFTHILGMQFIRDNHEQIDVVAQILIENPRYIPRLAALFNPQLIPARTLDYYARIIESYVRGTDNICAPVLMSFQFGEWLKSKPSSEEIKRAVGMFFQFSNKTISATFPKLANFNSQALLTMSLFDFPTNFIPLFEQIIAITLEKQAIPSLWDIFANAPLSKLDPQFIQQLGSLVSESFMSNLTQIITSQTLYEYFEPELLSSFMRFFESLIISLCQNQAVAEINTQFQPCLTSQLLFNLYLPFIGFVTVNSQNVPTFRENSPFTNEAFASFCRSVSTLQAAYPWTLTDFISLFFSTLSHITIPNVIGKYFQHLSSTINWEQTQPTLESMNQLLALSMSPHHDLIRVIISRISWKQAEQMLVNIQNPQSLFFYQLLFQIILNLIQRYQRYSDTGYATFFLNFLDTVTKSLFWENLNAMSYHSILESFSVDPNLVQYNRQIQLDFNIEFESMKFPTNITNSEQRGFVLLTAIRKIGFFDNDLNYDHIIPFLQFATYILSVSAPILRSQPIEEKDDFWKSLFSKKKPQDSGYRIVKVPDFAVPFSHTNFSLIFADLIRVALLDVTQSKPNLAFAFDLFSIQNPEAVVLLLKACTDYMQINPRISPNILFASCEKIRNLDDFVVLSEKAHDFFFTSKEKYENLLENFTLIDVDENSLLKSSIENSSFFTLFSFVTKRIKDYSNSLPITDTYSLVDKLLSLLSSSNLQFNQEFKFLFVFDLFIRGIDAIYQEGNRDFNQKFADKFKALYVKLENLSKKKGWKKVVEGMGKKDEPNQKYLICFNLLKIAYELVFQTALKNKKSKESAHKDFNTILNSKKSLDLKTQIEKIESIYGFKSQGVSPPQLISSLIKEFFIQLFSKENKNLWSFIDESRQLGDWKILK